VTGEEKAEDTPAEAAKKAEGAIPERRGRIRGEFGAARRANRNARAKEVPPVELPEWFWKPQTLRLGGGISPEQRIELTNGEDAWAEGLEETLGEAKEEAKKLLEEEADVEETAKLPSAVETGVADVDAEKISDDKAKWERMLKEGAFTPELKYSIDSAVYSEVLTNINAVLSTSLPAGLDSKDVIRPDILLQCPKSDGAAFLNTVVDNVAFDLNADIVRLNPTDIAQIVGDYMGENVAWQRCDTALLGYETEKQARYEDYIGKEEDDVEMEDEDNEGPANPLKALSSALRAGSAKLRGLALIPGSDSGSKSISFDELLNNGLEQTGSRGSSPSDTWNNFKMSAALEAVVDAPLEKMLEKTLQKDGEQSPLLASVIGDVTGGSDEGKDRPLILQLNNYKEMTRVPAGMTIIKMFRDVVKKRWLQGKQIMIVGTTTHVDIVEAVTVRALTHVQSDVVYGDSRTIVVTPSPKAPSRLFAKDEKARIHQINIRHLMTLLWKFKGSEDWVRQLVATARPSGAVVDEQARKNLTDAHAEMYADMSKSIWPYPRIHRLATTILGLPDDARMGDYDQVPGTPRTPPVVLRAYQMIQASDQAKSSWLVHHTERKAQENAAKASSKSSKSTQKLKAIKANCTKHEAKLLGGLVDPADIHTTFEDVRAPAETIEALQTLTSLSLIRPEAFSYGVLAKDKIPGVLLYGPPGTGKTLLAKALAKDSGTTVLEVSGSEIYDKYVGEGEKNVRAVFSLAKKLSPCIVFIDEADAIFGDRGSGRERTSHREIINQFLREWDGMNDLSAFIMVATNRPFDLDEAILRRLPRRILVDLPVEKDREAILGIHLKGETLAEDVRFAELAKQTPFYSGSDLKNLCVAAALTCVREENAAARAEAQAAGIDPAQSAGKLLYPEKRTLTKKHFETAMMEISASISEDMETLSAIRKFDERYGDRKGRRKKRTGMGFGREKEVVDEEAARVRQRDEVGVVKN
jgi:SpoVK/Ycf46/Vps4 family AAA+-type ATPase